MTLAETVVRITADTVGLERGLAHAMALVVQGMGQMSMAALASSSGVVRAFGLISGAMTAAVIGVFALTAAFGGVAMAGAQLEAAGHNVDEVFGRFSESVRSGAEEQARAFGQSKSEYLAYAAVVGRELEKLGINQEVAAISARNLLDATQRLAQSRRISFGEAFGITQARGALFSEAEVRGMAVQMGLLTNRNQVLDEGTAALVRTRLAIEDINGTTEAADGAGSNWNSQLIMLQGNLSNLAGMIGAEVEPAFVAFLQKVNALLETMIAHWGAIQGVIGGIMGVLGIEPGAGADVGEGAAAIDARNKAQIDAQRGRRIAGEVFGGGGHGGGGGGGFQGGLVEFARKVQGSAFNQRQIGLMQKQVAAAEKLVMNTDRMLRFAPWLDPKLKKPEIPF